MPLLCYSGGGIEALRASRSYVAVWKKIPYKLASIRFGQGIGAVQDKALLRRVLHVLVDLGEHCVSVVASGFELVYVPKDGCLAIERVVAINGCLAGADIVQLRAPSSTAIVGVAVYEVAELISPRDDSSRRQMCHVV